MIGDINALFTTGIKGCGTTTFLDVLLRTFFLGQAASGTIEAVDIKDTIGVVSSTSSTIGRRVKSCIASGAQLPDELLIEAFKYWVESETLRNQRLRALLISGAPKNNCQLQLLKSFRASTVVNLETDEATAQQVISNNQTGELFEQIWGKHVKETVPAIRRLNGKALHLNRSAPLIERIDCTLQHLAEQKGSIIPVKIVNNAMRKLGEPNNPVLLKIREIEGSRK